MDNFVAFIPARGGSKSIPYKNIKEFCGKPLVYWSIKAASDCQIIDAVYISTDDSLIKKTVEEMKLPKVNVIERGPETATDKASTELAMLEFAKKYYFQNIVLIQATSPLITSEDLTGGIYKLIDVKADSLLTVARQKRFLWEENQSSAYPLNYNPVNRPLRQQWEGFFVENGAFYITTRDGLLESECRISGEITLFEMEEDSYFEIDEESDWIIAENLKKKQLGKQAFQEVDYDAINLLVCDVDGVLTDAGMYYSNEGTELKKFNTRDGKGIELIRQAGIKVMLLTSEDISIVKDRANKLKVDYLFMGIKNKKQMLERFFEENADFCFDKTVYMGDDINDLDCIKLSKFSAVPNDAHVNVKPYAKYVCTLNGGFGCVREICDLLVNRRENA